MRSVTEILGGSTRHYTFISSISVFRKFPPGRPFDEDAPLAEGNEGYGALKARSEEVLVEALADRAAIVRPGLIVGPHDPTDRFTYWPGRVAEGGRVLAPGRPERSIQFVDVRDLAEWCVRLAVARRIGVFNAVGPASRLTMGEFLDGCRTVSTSDARFTWVPDADLIASGVEPWTGMPLWIPEDDPAHGGMLLADNHRAIAAGLTFRPTPETIGATLEWDRARGGPVPESRHPDHPGARSRDPSVTIMTGSVVGGASGDRSSGEHVSVEAWDVREE
jgi:2'-hydroxyisoflavone reductase